MPDHSRHLTPAMEDYLRAIYDLGREHSPVHTTALARKLGVAPASVTGMLKRLAVLGLVCHVRYGGAELTPAGKRIALQVLRHHRIIETYLAQALGIGWDEVHEEAHRLEHHVSERLQQRMAELLGHPERDPHGAPIPPCDGPFDPPARVALGAAHAYCRLVVREVQDGCGEVLRRLDAHGLRPDAEIEVLESPPDAPLVLRVGERQFSLERDLADAVFVEPLD